MTQTPTAKDFLFWFGKNLAQAGLLKNVPWVQENVQVAFELNKNLGVGWVSSCMATSHFYALDYLKQFPLLAVAAYKKYEFNDRTIDFGRVAYSQESGQFTLTREGYINIAKDMHYCCQAKMNLREMARYWQMPYQLREVVVAARKHMQFLNVCHRVHPSTLAQAIPHSARYQDTWLNMGAAWVERMMQVRPNRRPEDFGLNWLLTHCTVNNRPISRVLEDLADYYIEAPFLNNWSVEHAIERMNWWHTQGLSSKELGSEADSVIPFPFPLSKGYQIDGFQLKALDTHRKMAVEGKTMHHCLGSYGQRAWDSYFYTVEGPTGERSTLEIQLRHNIVKMGQHKAYCNAAPMPKAAAVAQKLLKHLRKLWEDSQKTS